MIKWHLRTMHEKPLSNGGRRIFTQKLMFDSRDDAVDYLSQHIREYNNRRDPDCITRFYKLTKIDTVKFPLWQRAMPIFEEKSVKVCRSYG